MTIKNVKRNVGGMQKRQMNLGCLGDCDWQVPYLLAWIISTAFSWDIYRQVWILAANVLEYPLQKYPYTKIKSRVLVAVIGTNAAVAR